MFRPCTTVSMLQVAKQHVFFFVLYVRCVYHIHWVPLVYHCRQIQSLGLLDLQIFFFYGAVYHPDEVIVFNHTNLPIGIEVSIGDRLRHGVTTKSFVFLTCFLWISVNDKAFTQIWFLWARRQVWSLQLGSNTWS